MTNSMTGYGSGSAASEQYQLTVEVKSVNHRFLEVYSRLPKLMSPLEDRMKKQVQARLNRGKLDVFVTLEQVSAKKVSVTVDNALAMAYYNSLAELALSCGLSEQVTLHQLAAFPGVLEVQKPEDDLEELSQLLQQATDQALTALLAMRMAEGESLAADLRRRLSLINGMVTEISGYAATVVEEQRQRLQSRIADILGDIAIDEARLANELAFYADKSDITEELTRLSSHICQFEQGLAAAESIGRKLDFILQEMLREINTIGSKSNTLAISKIVIEVKSELEKILS